MCENTDPVQSIGLATAYVFERLMEQPEFSASLIGEAFSTLDRQYVPHESTASSYSPYTGVFLKLANAETVLLREDTLTNVASLSKDAMLSRLDEHCGCCHLGQVLTLRQVARILQLVSDIAIRSLKREDTGRVAVLVRWCAQSLDKHDIEGAIDQYRWAGLDVLLEAQNTFKPDCTCNSSKPFHCESLDEMNHHLLSAHGIEAVHEMEAAHGIEEPDYDDDQEWSEADIPPHIIAQNHALAYRKCGNCGLQASGQLLPANAIECALCKKCYLFLCMHTGCDQHFGDYKSCKTHFDGHGVK